MMFRRLLIALLAAACSMHAAAGLFDEDARKEIAALRAQIDQQNKDNDARFQKLEEMIKNIGIIQLLNQIEQQNTELAKLRGQLEVLSNQNEQLQKRQKDFYFDIDSRLRKVEGLPPDTAAGAASTPVPAPVTAPPAAASPVAAPAAAKPAAPANRDKEFNAYDIGTNLFKKGDYLPAIRGFETFMKDYPGSGLVPNAQYWIGICHFNLKDYAAARTAQEVLLKNYPDSPKVPDAMLAIASVQFELGDSGSARNTLEDIIARYPASDAATKARTRLTPPKR